MRWQWTNFALVIGATLWAASPALAQVNNGDFESGGLSGWTVTDVSGNSVVSSGANFGLSPFSGATLAAFTGNSSTMNGNGGIIDQIVPVTAGQPHTVRFYLGGRGNTTAIAQTTLNVVDDGGSGANLVNQSLGLPPTVGSWQIHDFTFTPTTNSVQLSFQETSTNSSSRGPAIDLVSLNANPASPTQTTFSDFVFQTAADNGQAPAASGQFAGPLYIRERANENNPELEVNAFVKFDLSDLSNAPITKAELLLHQNNKLNSVNSSPMYLAQVLEDWDPGTNDPTFGQLVGEDIFFGDNGAASAGPVVDIDHIVDVTDIVRDWQDDPSSNFGFRLRLDDLFVGAAFDDTGPNAPRLVVTQAAAVPEPTTIALWTIVGLVGACFVLARRRSR